MNNKYLDKSMYIIKGKDKDYNKYLISTFKIKDLYKMILFMFDYWNEYIILSSKANTKLNNALKNNDFNYLEELFILLLTIIKEQVNIEDIYLLMKSQE